MKDKTSFNTSVNKDNMINSNNINNSKKINKFSFSSFGHELISGEHYNTLEFTKDNYLTKKGDCIVGINSNFNLSVIKDFIKSSGKIFDKVFVSLSKNKIKEDLSGFVNSNFSSNKELVIRKSNFPSSRTLITLSNKASLDLDKSILPNKNECLNTDIKRITHNFLVMDYDDTINNWSIYQELSRKKILKEISQDLNIDFYELHSKFMRTKHIIIRKARKSNDFSRTYWLEETLKEYLDKKIINQKYVEKKIEEYWAYFNENHKLKDYALDVIKYIKEKYPKLKIIILTDSDGTLKIKEKRLSYEKELMKNIDLLLTGDNVRTIKPYDKIYDYLKKEVKDKLNANFNFHKSIFIGDRFEIDLRVPKSYGATTILISNKKQQFADFNVKNWIEIKKIIDNLNIIH